jgi:succinate-semialdehyde dehydrogenase / glutarate-semialdehyde dehydrogenase
VTASGRTCERLFLRADDLLADATDMVITKEETFGLVAPLYCFKTDDEAFKMANDTEFGLAVCF